MSAAAIRARWRPATGRWRVAAAALCAVLATTPCIAQQRVQFPSLDGPAAAPVLLSGLFFRSATVVGGTRGAVLMLHGCSGLWRGEARDALQPRYLDYVRLFNDEGWHVLLVDSLTPRGVHETCTEKIAARSVRAANRRRDALAALQWLGGQDGVDGARLALVGWSHGGSALLSTLNLRHAEVTASAIRPRAAVAFYPGCDNELRVGFEPAAPLMLLLGAADDWMAPAACRELAQKAAAPGAAAVQSHAYPGAHHGFDGDPPVRLRTDVTNGLRGGNGAHVGGDPQARADSRRRLIDFLREKLR